jgi:alkanesulfonate monooxygenase SsuD/methylene tetrahydromethanopterin reductase-like flavin-dependent oxidoreductase (luciferase family)
MDEIGISGMLFVFYDYLPDLKKFGEEILPLLEAEGIRTHRRGEPV